MDAAHWHLVVNHLPIIFPVAGAIIMITGLVSKSESVKRTAYLIFAIGALSALVAMSTGEGAEDTVEQLSGVSEDYIERHEETAETFALLSYVLGGLSLLGLWASFKEKSFSYLIAIGTLIFAFIVLFMGKETGTTGGEIRHTEIRSGDAIPAATHGEHEDEDDH